MTYYVDGFTPGQNPSRIGGGFTVLDDSANLLERREVRRYFTNNEGELLGIAYAVARAQSLRRRRDRQPVRNRMGEKWPVKGQAGSQ